MNATAFDHVAVAVPSIEEARSLYELLTGKTCSRIEEIPGQSVAVAFVGAVELLEPLEEDSPVGRFLARRGPGLHHVAFRVADLDAAVAHFRKRGLRPIDPGPRQGARGHRVVFLHPESTGKTLVELVEHRPGLTAV